MNTTINFRRRMISDYSRFLNRESLARQPSAIRALQPLLQIPGMISLGGGMPHPSTFPFKSMQVNLAEHSIQIDEKELLKGLQYSQTQGLPDLISAIKSLQKLEHSLDYEKDVGCDVAVFNGSQDAIAKAFAMLVSPGDTILVESPTYSGTLALLKPMDCNLVGIDTDSNGIIVEELEKVLVQSSSKKPKVLYIIPNASNPSGATYSIERKIKVYELAKRFDLLILEDDPYYYLQFNPPRQRSFLSIDDNTDRRVLRFDSFSKVLSSGLRIGFASGPKQLIDRMVLHSQATNLHSSGLSQLLICKLFDLWGVDGFLKHCTNVASFYLNKRNVLINCLNKYMKDKAEWNVPEGGMFVWIKLKGYEDSSRLIKEKALEKKVILLPGVEFMPNGQKSSFVRASYSTSTEQEIEEAIRRLSEII